MNTRVLFIGGAPHSGSTLLGLMLGAHPSIFYTGEAKNTLYFDDPRYPLDKRVCKLCGPGCVVWGDLRLAGGQGLYEVLSRRTNCPIIVDSTKRPDWIEQQSAALRDVVPLRLIVLARDGRAVVNSRLRKYPEISARDHAAAWVAQTRGTEELASRFPGPVHRVRDEELVLRPEPMLRALAGFLGVVFDPAMLTPWASDQHPLGGNDGTQFLLVRERVTYTNGNGPRVIKLCDRARRWYGTHARGIVFDLRWKDELSADEVAAFDAVAGQTNRSYMWEESVQ